MPSLNVAPAPDVTRRPPGTPSSGPVDSAWGWSSIGEMKALSKGGWCRGARKASDRCRRCCGPGRWTNRAAVLGHTLPQAHPSRGAAGAWASGVGCHFRAYAASRTKLLVARQRAYQMGTSTSVLSSMSVWKRLSSSGLRIPTRMRKSGTSGVRWSRMAAPSHSKSMLRRGMAHAHGGW